MRRMIRSRSMRVIMRISLLSLKRNPKNHQAVPQVHQNHQSHQNSQRVEIMILILNKRNLNIKTYQLSKKFQWTRTPDTLFLTSPQIGTKVDSESTSSDAMNVISITTIPDIQKMSMWMHLMTWAMRSSMSSLMLKSLAIRTNLLIMVVLISIYEDLGR